MGILGRVKAASILAIVASAAICAGCYTPDFNACSLRCAFGATAECPPNQQCLADNFCHASAADEMCPCLPLRCDELGGKCGMIDDGCKGTIDCGCTDPDSCGGGGVTGMCGHGNCTPQQCPLNTCGPFETCGMTLHCQSCVAPATCGGDGMLDKCGTCADAVFMPGFPAMNCGTQNPWYCSNINACLHDKVNCLTRSKCPGDPTEYFCPCGFVNDCVKNDCVPGAN
jgi:hypothetical protein